MDDVCYLVHTTNYYNSKWNQLNTSNIKEYEHQFPGAYLTIVTKKNINNVQLYPENYQILIYSRRLLEQKNYHINIRDYNGYISENNTYFPWNLNDAIKKINKNNEIFGNEVVFHDPIPNSYLCVVINHMSSNIKAYNDLLPRIPIENNIEPDMSLEPFYCYPLEKNYTGINPFPESSRYFFVNMAKTCNVNTNLSTDEIITEIKKKIINLYSNRNKQNIHFLKKNKTKKNKKSL